MVDQIASNRHTLLNKFLSFIVCLFSFSSFAYDSKANDAIEAAVLIPNIQGPARRVYENIVKGIDANPLIKVSLLPIEGQQTPEQIADRLRQKSCNTVIALGNAGYALAKGLQNDFTVVAGGISGKPNGIPTVSMTIAPNTVLQQLKQTAPHINQLLMVYDDKTNGWWVKQAQLLAQKYEIEIVAFEATSLKHGVKQYETMLKAAKAEESAVWIPLSNIVPAKTIIPLVLRKAWSKKLVVVSNNPSHARLGSLIALYPNNEEMGAQIANMAVKETSQLPSNTENSVIEGTKRVRSAYNWRTGAHLGIRINDEQENTFDRIYPAQR